jgi:hypothetical protein
MLLDELQFIIEDIKLLIKKISQDLMPRYVGTLIKDISLAQKDEYIKTNCQISCFNIRSSRWSYA